MLRIFSKFRKDTKALPSADEVSELRASREAFQQRMDRIVELSGEGVRMMEAERDDLQVQVLNLTGELSAARAMQDQLQDMILELNERIMKLSRVDAEVDNLKAAAESVLNLLK